MGETAQPNDRFSLRTFLVLAVVFVFPLLVVLAYVATRNELPELTGLRISVPNINISETNNHPINFTGGYTRVQLFPSLRIPSFSGLPVLGTVPQVDLVVGLLLVTFAVAIFIILRGIAARRVPTSPFEDPDLLAQRRQKVASLLDDAATRLRSGSSYRETVIQCYKLITEYLEEKSSVDGKVLTPREFRKLVSEKLGIDSPQLAQVTSLFEVARYSDREITSEQAQEAAACMSELSAPMKETVASVSDIK